MMIRCTFSRGNCNGKSMLCVCGVLRYTSIVPSDDYWEKSKTIFVTNQMLASVVHIEIDRQRTHRQTSVNETCHRKGRAMLLECWPLDSMRDLAMDVFPASASSSPLLSRLERGERATLRTRVNEGLPIALTCQTELT